ncbi:sulfatase-like hydrolase/transferase [Streptomyces sp. NBC_00257]|uniref:sulfatase family protein n=1 Tax=unclassified Streptomyces TaxID=2593676 RepID=UPI002258979A|nr:MULTISPECIES: sulfatase-like hydrolase/transferase [unclassified Streptomyces]MCX5426187.1 sulfatase-like hydrolase/transferase [Streptomyces sp. NBC_00062]
MTALHERHSTAMQSAPPAEPLNVLWLYCDELRADALGCYATGPFHPHTPAVDQLAASGAVFHECYTNSPVCVPSRTALLTGQPPERTGVYHNEAYADGFPLPPGLTIFPEVFARHGYRTASFGKEHIPAGLTPWQVNDPAGGSMRAPLSGRDPADCAPMVTPNGKTIVAGVLPEGQPYPPAQVTKNTTAWIAQAREPFLVRASFLQPHTPVIVPHAYGQVHRPEDFPDVLPGSRTLSRFERRFAEVSGGGPDADSAVARQAHASYHNLVSWVDAQLAILMNALRAKGVADRTVVVLTSDHGAHLGENGAYGKHTFARGSHRVPLIISAPGRLAHQTRTDLAQSLDLARTLFGLCGIEAPESFDGRDLFNDPAPAEIFSTIGFGAPWSRAFPNQQHGTYEDDRGWPRRSCVRTDRYRLDATVRIDGHAPRDAEEEDLVLIDHVADPDETVNLAGDPKLAYVVQDMRALLMKNAADVVEVDDDLLKDLALKALERHRELRRTGRSAL